MAGKPRKDTAAAPGDDGAAAAISARLKRIEGQVRGIDRVIQEDRPCEEVLIQIMSIKAALNSLILLLVDAHLDSCIGGDSSARTRTGLKRVLKLLCRAP